MNPESRYIAAIHRQLPDGIYHWKISDRFTSGVPDCWYCGNKASIWVEYKALPKPPKQLLPKLTAHQLRWLNEMSQLGQNTAVVVGFGKVGTILTNNLWEVPRTGFSLLSHKEIAAWIQSQTMHTTR